MSIGTLFHFYVDIHLTLEYNIPLRLGFPSVMSVFSNFLFQSFPWDIAVFHWRMNICPGYVLRPQSPRSMRSNGHRTSKTAQNWRQGFNSFLGRKTDLCDFEILGTYRALLSIKPCHRREQNRSDRGLWGVQSSHWTFDRSIDFSDFSNAKSA